MARPRVVVTDYTFPDLERERQAAEAAGAEFVALQCRSAEEVTAALVGASLAVVQFAPVTASAVAGMQKGGALIRYGIGYDNIDVAAAAGFGLPVGYVPDYCTDEVTEHTCAMLLTLLRKLPALDASVRAGQWAAVATAGAMKAFADTTIGFLGFGNIGRNVHARLRGFGFRFAVTDPMLTEAEASALGMVRMSMEEMFSTADAITLHAPTTPQTRHVVNAARLATMKPGAVIVNTSRGALVDERALAAALRAGLIAGAALDVFEVEPLDAGSPLRDAPGLVLTPHAAWYSDAAIGRLQGLVAQDIASFLAGRPLRRPVPGSYGGP